MVWRKLANILTLRWNVCFRVDPSVRVTRRGIPGQYRLEFPCDISALKPESLPGGHSECAALQQRVACGDLLGIVWCDNKVAHRSLVQTRGVAALEALNHGFELHSGEYYIHWCETYGAHQGHGLYREMLSAIAVHLPGTPGFKWVRVCCRQNNLASVQGIIKSGFVYERSCFAMSVMKGRWSRGIWYKSRRPPVAAS